MNKCNILNSNLLLELKELLNKLSNIIETGMDNKPVKLFEQEKCNTLFALDTIENTVNNLSVLVDKLVTRFNELVEQDEPVEQYVHESVEEQELVEEQNVQSIKVALNRMEKAINCLCELVDKFVTKSSSNEELTTSSEIKPTNLNQLENTVNHLTELIVKLTERILPNNNIEQKYNTTENFNRRENEAGRGRGGIFA